MELASETDFDGWRQAARDLCSRDVPPEKVSWASPDTAQDLFDHCDGGDAMGMPVVRTVKATEGFLAAAEKVACHRDRQRFARLYRLLYRLQRCPTLLSNPGDADVAWLEASEKAIRRDVHKYHAFVRFRKVCTTESGHEQFAAWFEPTHRTTRLSAPFFQRRFPNMDWMIVAPDCTAVWDGIELRFLDGGTRRSVPAQDAVEDQWRTYFRSIFNPARLKLKAMTAEMPKKYWRNLPESESIGELVRHAHLRASAMRETDASTPNRLADILAKRSVPDLEQEEDTLEDAQKAALRCERCPLFRDASQTVFGEGPVNARLMIVGEQPGDEEDIAGRPFVGPAGRLLDQALAEAGIDRTAAYVTNAVKHFKYEVRGKRRIHSKPNAAEIDHCRWWLDKERRLVRPDFILALGASAVRGITGRSTSIATTRGTPIELGDATRMVVTYHPSYILRAQTGKERKAAHANLIDDLAIIRNLLAG